MAGDSIKDGVAEPEIQAALTRVLQSRLFMRSKTLQRMLRFIVEETLAGRGERLKEYVLGVEVFDRPESFDPRLDSIVRVEARRLRNILGQYYADQGRADPVIIELAKGSYLPYFRRRIAPRALPAVRLRGKWVWIAAAILVAVAAIWYYRVSAPAHARLPRNATIAVLPFDNLTADADNGYLCFGLMDEITTELAKIAELRVVARTSAANFKRGDDIATIARRLGVDAVLEGSVQRFQDRVLVTAQLIDAATSLHIWAETYERPSADLIKVQNDIAQAVTHAVRRQLPGGSVNGTRQIRYSTDARANVLYWKGAYLRAPMGRANWRSDLLKAADYFEQAARKDDHFALAYAALSDVYVSLAWERGGNAVTREFMERGRRAAVRALELDDNHAEALGALGTVQFFYEYDPEAAEKSFQRAFQADPSNGKARMWYAYALVMQRRGEEAIAQARQARELDPLSYVATTHLAVVNYFSRHYDEAMKLVQETLDVADIAPAHGLRGMILAAEGKYAEAIDEYRAGLRLVPTHSYIKGMLGHAYAMSGRADEARQLLKDVGVDFEKGGLSELKASYIHLALGDKDQALACLERDYDQRDPELPYINVDPVFDPLRNEPRFAAILRRMKLAQ